MGSPTVVVVAVITRPPTPVNETSDERFHGRRQVNAVLRVQA